MHARAYKLSKLLFAEGILYNSTDNNTGILFTIIVVDTIVSYFIISNLKKVSNKVENDNAPKDNTEEISKKVKETTEEITQKLIDGAEDAAMEFSSQVYHMSRRVNIGRKKHPVSVCRLKKTPYKRLFLIGPGFRLKKLNTELFTIICR